MGEPLADKRWNDARKKQLRDSRVVGTRALVDALRDLPRRPRLLISASGCGILRRPRRRDPDGSAQPGTGFLADWRATGRPRRCAPPTSDCAWCCCATASCSSKSSGILRKILPPFRLGLGGPARQRRQWLPWIHIEDHIGLIRHVMSHEAVSGPLNCVAPEPVTNAEFARALGEVLGRPAVLKAPLFALRAALQFAAGGRGAAGEPARDARAYAGDRLFVPAPVAARGAGRGPGEAPSRRDRPSRDDHLASGLRAARG
jgi:uncharacterized protein (TIGR01777 family)